MITKKRKLAAIKKQMDSVKGLGNIKNVRFTDIINETIMKIKKAGSFIDKLENNELNLDKVIEWIKTELQVDKKITDFLNEIFTLGNLFNANVNNEFVLEILDKTQYALELMNMYQINNLKIENSVERMPFIKAIQILYSMDDKESEKLWESLLEKSNDKKTVDFKDMCVWIVTKK